jgi:NAD+ diphosphatase
MMSTLAGFVEPGESVEEAVVREVEEEVGMIVTDLSYQGSQPWPFPSSVMLGYFASVDAGMPIILDTKELEDARWFTRSELTGIKDLGFKLPHRDSIARWLVEKWMAKDGQ